jgi:hypothetical protein
MAITLVFALVVSGESFRQNNTVRKLKTQCFSEWMQTHFSRHCETPQFLHYAAVRQEDEEKPYLAQEWLLVRFTKEN